MTDIQRLPTGAAMRFVPAPGTGPAERRATILVVHGWTSTPFSSPTYTSLIEGLGRHGFNIALMSLRGHEGTDEDINSVTRDQHLADIAAAIDFMTAHPNVDPARCGALGVSYGAYLLSIAQDRSKLRFKAIAFRAPALYPNERWEEPIAVLTGGPMHSWRLDSHVNDGNAALNAIGSFTGQLLIVASENDTHVPEQTVMDYKACATRAPSSVFVLHGAGHVLDTEQRDAFLSKIIPWFSCALQDSVPSSPH